MPSKPHIERRTAGKYPAEAYLAVVYKGEVLGTFTDHRLAEVYLAGVVTGLERV